jgi:hypothetical protein
MGQAENISGRRAVDPFDFVTLIDLQNVITVMGSGSHIIPLYYTTQDLQDGLINNTVVPGNVVFVTDAEPQSLVLVNSDKSLTYIPYEQPEEGIIEINVKWLCLQLLRHIKNDESRWQNMLDAIVISENKIMALIQSISSSSVDNYDYSNPTTIIGTDGLITVGQNKSATITANGAIKCSVGGLLSAVIDIKINDVTVWSSPLSIVGNTNSSGYIVVSEGDVVSTNGVLGLGQVINVTFYPAI